MKRFTVTARWALLVSAIVGSVAGVLYGLFG